MFSWSARVVILAILPFSFSCTDSEFKGCKPFKASSALDVYQFPLVPGMPGWENLNSGEEMYAATQLPPSVLTSITTLALVETCYNYPLRLNMIAWPTLQQGVETIVGIFNGFQELAKRPDGGSALVTRYDVMDPSCFQGFDNEVEMGRYTLSNSLFEAVVAQDVYLSMLSTTERQTLLERATEYYFKKKDLPTTYGVFDLKSSAIVMARAMIKEEYVPFLLAIQENPSLQLFVDEIELEGSTVTLDIVANFAIEFNKNN